MKGLYQYFFNITLELCPPKPNVLLRAYLTSRFCGLSRVRLSFGSILGSSSFQFMVGAMMPFVSAIMQASDSTAPAAPSRWPVIDLVELMFML